MKETTGKKRLKKGMVIGFVFGSIALIVLVAVCVQLGYDGSHYREDGGYKHVSAGNSYGHIIEHPVFENTGMCYSSLQEGAFKQMRLFSLRSVSLWCGWNSQSITESINYLIDKANNDAFEVINVYSEREQAEDLSMTQANMLFLKGEPYAPYAIVIAGGAFQTVAAPQEGFPYAAEINKAGYNVFILSYRVKPEMSLQGRDNAVSDLVAAIKHINANAGILKVSTEGYSLWGSSAGGTMILSFCSSQYENNYKGNELAPPSAIALAYPAVYDFLENDTEFYSDYPSAFILVGQNDGLISVKALESYVRAMNSNNLNVSFTIHDNFKHGAGHGIGSDAEGWILDAVSYWEAS